MNRNKALSIMAYSLGIGLVLFGIYSVFILEPDERALQISQAKQVAKNLSMLTSDQIDCDDINKKLMRIDDETFEGKNLIKNALMDTMIEGDCFEGLESGYIIKRETPSGGTWLGTDLNIETTYTDSFGYPNVTTSKTIITANKTVNDQNCFFDILNENNGGFGNLTNWNLLYCEDLP